MQKIGLFFGSFNPIHIGHLIIANTMLETTDLDEVRFVVSPQNPHKKRNTLLHEFDRLHMVESAISGNYKMRGEDVEFNMPVPSYTIDTLTYLQEREPDKKFILIIGEDNLQHFHKWKNYEQILENYELYVYPRPDSPQESELKNHPKVKMVKAPLLDISATYIRDLIKNNKSVQFLIPPEVEGYISSKGLYKE
jgi:nicotinate-nucleotide adenylyltransferase